MNVLFSVVLLKINLPTLLTNHNTEKYTLNISVKFCCTQRDSVHRTDTG